MEEREVFVYWIKDGKVIQDKCIAIPKSKGTFMLKGYKRQPQTVYYSILDYCERNRVISFEDDYPCFKQMIIDDLEARVEETKKRLCQDGICQGGFLQKSTGSQIRYILI